MTPARLIIKNVFRNRRRTLLTVASVAVSILLLAIFCAAYRYIDAPPAPTGFHLVLLVVPRTSLMMPLPLSYTEQIRRLPGVVAVSPVNMVDGVHRDEDTPAWGLACHPEIIFRIMTDWDLPPEQRLTFANEKVALIAGRRVADRYGWKLGERIHLRSRNYHVTLELTLRGIYSSTESESLLAFHWEYLNEALGRPNKPGGFWVRAQSAEDVPRLMQAIDAQFRNSDVETWTQPMKQHLLDIRAMLGNVKLILLSVSTAVVFAILLVAANTMGMLIRERTVELAVLRALGFRTKQLLGLLTAESLASSLAGALLGCLMAGILLALTAGNQIGGPMPLSIRLDTPSVMVALGVAVAISLGGTLIPACRAS